jgi:hypothetical protein
VDRGPEEDDSEGDKFFDALDEPYYVPRDVAEDSPWPDIDIVLGRDHVQGLVYNVLVPWLNSLFGDIKIPDIDIPVISLKALTIERLALDNVEVLRERPPFAHPEVVGRPQLGVTTLTSGGHLSTGQPSHRADWWLQADGHSQQHQGPSQCGALQGSC